MLSFQILGFMDKATMLQYVLVVCRSCDGQVGTHIYVPEEGCWCSFMVDFMSPVIMCSTWF